MVRTPRSPASPCVVELRGVVAFAVLACVEMLLWLLVTAQAETSASVSAHLLALAHGVFPGFVSCLVLFLYERWPGRTRSVGVLVCVIGGSLLIAEDFDNLAARSGVPLLGRALGGAAGALIPLAALVAARFQRVTPRLALSMVVVALEVLAHAWLPRGYPGLHLVVLLASGAGLSALLPPLRLPCAAWSLAACGLALVLVPPGSAALVTILRQPGLAVTPFVARAHASFGRARDPISKAGRSARPPTSPGLALESPLVVLLTIDAVRADVLARHGDKLPNLRALAGESVRFTMARTAAPSTVVALNALFTGRHYTETRWAVHPRVPHLFPHLDDSARFPALLAEAGIASVALDTTEWLLPEYGISRGFSRVLPLERTRGDAAAASQIVDALVAEIAREPKAPALFYAHFLEPHAPYDLAGKQGDDWSRYVGEIAIVDHEIGRLVEALRVRGEWDRTVFIVTSDHGEAFGEHFAQFHGLNVYDELLRVPLWLRVPGVLARDVDAPVSLMDLGPTVLDLFGQPTPGSFDGETLVPALRGVALPERPIAAVSGRLIEAVVFPDGFKVIYDKRTGAAELYDLKSDPGETRNLFDGMGDYLPQLEALRSHFEPRELRTDGYEAPFRPM